MNTTAAEFPTREQRSVLDETNFELLSIIRRAANSDGFAAFDTRGWASQLCAWPEVGTDTAQREQFVRERVRALVRLGAVVQVERFIDGKSAKGLLVGRSAKAESSDPNILRLTQFDQEFLARCGIASLQVGERQSTY